MTTSQISPPVEQQVPSLQELLVADPDQFVARYTDVAAYNLTCARELPHADETNFLKYMELLDTIAESVRQETERNWRLFKLKPAQFHHSEAVYRLYTMEHVFRVRFQIKYDPVVHRIVDRDRGWVTSDSSEVFIHGVLGEKRTGTCSSLPTFAIAVGRRLGYPLKLILVPNHTLYRWDDGDEVHNLQHTEAGGNVHPDEYFHQWPRKWTEGDFLLNERTHVWLHSMTPRQEVSKFLCTRATFLYFAGRYDEAIKAVDAAQRFNPINPACNSIRNDILYKQHNCSCSRIASANFSAIQSGSLAAHEKFFSEVSAVLRSVVSIELPLPQHGSKPTSLRFWNIPPRKDPEQ